MRKSRRDRILTDNQIEQLRDLSLESEAFCRHFETIRLSDSVLVEIVTDKLFSAEWIYGGVRVGC